MRVVGGSPRGRLLKAPHRGESVRPTADRVREAIFDILGSLTDLDGASVVDLFAGSGALGIEAASRGCSVVTFVEKDRAAAAVIKENLVRTGLDRQVKSEVVVADALGFCTRRDRRFGVALVDPPYAFCEWPALLSSLDAAIVVCESARPVATEPHYRLHREYRYGTTLVTVAMSHSDVTGDGL